MKRTVFIGAVAAVLMMTGCSQKEEVKSDMDSNANQAQAADTKVSSVTSVGTGSGEGINTVDMAMSKIKDLEAKLQTVYFDFDSYSVRADQKGKVATNADILKGESGFTYKIEGNCDEWGTDEYNYALGLKRARSVRDSLIANGINKASMIMVSYGESKPVCEEKNKSCWSKNRRVDVKVLP